MKVAVEKALAELRPALYADGFDLRLGEIGANGTVNVVLEALPAACIDCLVPDHTLIAILEAAIRKQDAGLSRVVLTKVNF